jgi:hypothetical protein
LGTNRQVKQELIAIKKYMKTLQVSSSGDSGWNAGNGKRLSASQHRKLVNNIFSFKFSYKYDRNGMRDYHQTEINLLLFSQNKNKRLECRYFNILCFICNIFKQGC